MATLVDSYSNSNISYDSPISNSTYHGQSFTCSQTLPIYSCTFYLKKDAGATGNLHAMLAEHSGTYGTSSEAGGYGIASSGDVSIDTVGTSYTAITFTFTGTERYIMQSGTYYSIVVFRSSGGTGRVYTGTDNTSPTHSGNKFIVGTPYATHDLAFAVYGEAITPPTVTTQDCSSIATTSVTGNGNITSIGSASVSRRGFCYKVGTSGDPTVADSTAYDNGTFGTGAYTKSIGSLSQGTTYRVRAYAVNVGGTSYGTTVSVTTLTTPTVTTQNCSNITFESAVGNGNITATGGAAISRRGFCYKAGTSGDPTVSDSVAYDDGTFGTGAYTKAITGLSADTGYRVRAYAINSVGTSYGDTVQLTTAGANAPVVSTTTTSRLNRKCVIFGGNVTDEGSQAVTERGIYYGTDEFTQSTKLISSSGAGAYSIFLSGLTPNTKYYFKAFATSSIGTSYGNILNFTTGNSLAVNDKTAFPPFNKA